MFESELNFSMEWGIAGTFFFGLLSLVLGIYSLYEGSDLRSLKRAIRAHSQSAYNGFWNVGNEMEYMRKAIADATKPVDREAVQSRCTAANALSIFGRNEVVSFARQNAEFVPVYQEAWNPRPIPSTQERQP